MSTTCICCRYMYNVPVTVIKTHLPHYSFASNYEISVLEYAVLLKGVRKS